MVSGSEKASDKGASEKPKNEAEQQKNKKDEKKIDDLVSRSLNLCLYNLLIIVHALFRAKKINACKKSWIYVFNV